jgi:uncharacterized protein involved in exopolysaccharide biosynthesis
LLLIAPVVLTLGIALGLALSQPRVYQSSTRMWFDQSSLKLAQLSGFSAPAAQQGNVLKELLKTRSFDLSVGRRGPLSAVLAQRARTPGGWTARPRHWLVKLGILSPLPASSLGAIDDAVVAALSTQATVDSTGPQVITVTYSDADPGIAAGTAQAIVDEFSAEMLANEQTQSKAAVDFYQGQVTASSKALSAADQAVYAFVVAHPPPRGTTLTSAANTVEDPALVALRHNDDLARSQYDGLSQKLQSAQLDQAALQQPGAAGFHIVDQAQIPTSPLHRTRTLLYAVIGGLVGGLLISLVALVLLTLADGSLRRPEEVQRLTGLRTVGAIPRVS